MRTQDLKHSRAGRFRWPMIAASGLLALAVAGWGCGDSQGVSSDLAPSASDVSAGGSAGETGNAPAVPTLDELRGLLNLTEAQAQLMQTALDEWRAEMAAHGGRDRRRGPGDGPPDGNRRLGDGLPDTTGHPGGGMGPGGPPAGAGAGPTADRPMGPPILGFLAKVSSFLDTTQFTTLAGYFVEQRARHEPADPATAPPGAADRMAAHWAQELGIDRGSAADLAAALGDAGKALRDLGKAYADGTVTLDGVRSGAGDIRVQAAGRAQEILGSENYAKLVRQLADRRVKMAEGILAHLAEGSTREADGLGGLLNLDDAGKQAVANALDAFTSQRQTLWEGIRDGQVVFEEALYRSLQIDAAARSAVRATLTDDSSARLDAVEPLLPRPRLLPLYF